MPSLIFDTCCGCINLRTGCLIIGYLQLVCEIVFGVLMILMMTAVSIPLKIEDEDDQKYMDSARTIVMVVGGIMCFFLVLAMAFTITLLVGVHNGKRGHVKAYLIYAVIFMVIGVISFFANLAGSGNTAASISSNLISIVLNIYFLLVVRSFYHKMGENKGPAVYSTA